MNGQGATRRRRPVRSHAVRRRDGRRPDGRQLLERFTAQGGETAELAFATLVERHGPMVLRVCRSVLRDPDEAQDAFQATFLVLVRRAGSSGCGTRWVPGSIRLLTALPRAPARPRPGGAGTSGGPPSCPARVCAKRTMMTWEMSSMTR